MPPLAVSEPASTSLGSCNPWVSGGAEASVDGAVGVGGAAAGRGGGGRPP